jgi:hypothetical protein
MLSLSSLSRCIWTLCITWLILRPGAVPHIREIDGDYQITPEGLSWTPSIADIENGRLEFNVAGDDSEGFFPVEVRYNTSKTFSSVDVTTPLQRTLFTLD